MVNVHRKPIHSFGERYKAVGQEIASALDPTRNIDAQTIEVLKRNIGGDQSFERWQDKMKSYHNSGATSCGKIWGSEYIAYRCRTCAFNSCMSLCAPCFEAGDHEGHDFNMFKSGAGGACDCGDTNVMCEKGVCPKHVSKVIVAPNPPAEALEPCTPIISSIVYRLLHELRVKFQDIKRENIEEFLKVRQEREERSRSTTSSTRTPTSPQDIPVPPPPEDVERMTESPLPTEFGQDDEPMPGDEITVQSPPPEGGHTERPDDIAPLELAAAGLMDAESPEVEEMDTDMLDTDEFIDTTDENAAERAAELLRRIGEAHEPRISAASIEEIDIVNDLKHIHFNREPEFKPGFSLLVDFLIQLIQIGTTLQDVVVSVLFQSLADFESCERPEMNHENQEIFRRTRDYVYEKLLALNNYVHEDDEKCTAALRFDLSSSSTVLEEFAFWLSRMHFPDTLNNFLLHLLPNDAYKEQLTGCFVKNYVFTAKSLTISAEPDSLANRIVHISVQLLSNEALVMRMIKERSLLEVFIQSLGLLFRQTLKPGIDKRKVVDCRHDIVQQTVYWPIISDLNNCLHHPSVARELVESSDLYYEYLRIINWFTGMDVQSRALGDHISYDRLFYVSFYLEKEGSAVPLSGIISMLTGKEHFEDEQQWKNTVTGTWKCLMLAYRNFFVSKSSGKLDPDTITFSISLPRQMSAIIYHLRKSLPGLGWKEFFSFERDQLESFLHTAQHTIAGMHEVRARVWIRNGDNTRSLVHVYRSASFSGTTFDLDLHLVQLVWAYLPPNLLVQQLFERLRVWKMIKSDDIDEAIDDICSDTTLDESKIASLLESAMITILTTIGVEKFTTEITPIEQLEKEVICVLAARDRGHSDLADQIPGLSDVQEYDVSNFKLKSSDLDEVLTRVATFNKPKDLGEGSYSLSEAGWAKYDPIFTLHRCVLVEDLMRCRQKHYLKLRGNRPEKDANRLIGLNYRPLPKLSDMYRGLYDVLKSSLLHSICFLTFWHHIQDEDCFRSSMVAYCLIILDWAIDTSDFASVKDTDPESGWSLYSSDCIMTNSLQEIEGKGCMLDLLVKLCYHKNYKKEDDNEGFNGSADTDMLNLIKRIILKFSNKSATCQTKINAVRAQFEANEEKRRAKNNKDGGNKVANKKLMAQEARKRALEKMKKKSAAFSTENKADLEGTEIAMETSDVDSPICCICRQGGTNLALMCYVHKTKISHYQTTGQDNKLELFNRYRENMQVNVCQQTAWKCFGGRRKRENVDIDDLMEEPYVASIENINNGQSAEVFVRDADHEDGQHNAKTVLKTCGHYIHIKCHRTNSSKPPESTDVVFDHNFACPMCRCFYTVLLPTGKDFSIYGLSVRHPDEKMALVRTSDVIPYQHSQEQDFLFYHSILRSLRELGKIFYGSNLMGHSLSAFQDMLELDILSIESDATNNHRTPLRELIANSRSKMPLEFEIYSRHVNLLFQLLHNNMQIDLAFNLDRFTPVLIMDPKRLLILFTISMKSMSQTLFHTFVRALFKLTYVQACVKIILEHNLFSPSDLSSDLPQETKVIFSTIASIIRDEEAAFGVNAHREYISSSVLTKSALLEKIQQYMTPFIKMSALLCHHVFPYSHSIEPDLKWSTKHDIFSLCSYIGIIPELENNDAINEFTEDNFDLVDLFPEPVPFIQNLLQNYLHAANLNTKKIPPGKNKYKKLVLSNSAAVLLKPVFFNKPQLLKPPKLFRDLLNSCLKTPCQACGKLPKKSVICLVCGELICYNEHDNRSQADNPCQEAGNISPIKSHIDKCSAGNGIFFVLFDVSIMIIRNNMILRRWGSIYLDKYEEEDFKIRRGKPLYLSETRFNILEKIWISSAFPSESPRQNRERFGFVQPSSTWQRFRDNL